MLGAIIGDIIGSRFEHTPTKSKSFELFTPDCRFTDDTVLTIAIMNALLTQETYTSSILRYTVTYPHTGFSGRFLQWSKDNIGLSPEPYNSFGNGSAMRVAPIGRAFTSVESVLEEARKTAEISHAHAEGIKGAQSVALGVYLALNGFDKKSIKTEIQHRFQYNLDRGLSDIRPQYAFDVTCQGSVPEAIICFLESTDIEDAIRNAVSLGGDSDTQACIAGGLAEAYYKDIPEWMVEEAKNRLPEAFIKTLLLFYDRFNIYET